MTEPAYQIIRDAPLAVEKYEPSANAKLVGSAKWMVGGITAADLQSKEFPPVRYALPGFIPEGVTILAGRPKIKKSWAALDMCMATAAGRFVFGTLRPAQGDVLYLALEDSQRRLKRRLRTIMQGDDGSWPTRCTFHTKWKRANEGGLQDLREWCTSVRTPTLIMIDTLEKFRPPPKGGQQTYTTDYEAISGLQALARDFPGLAVVVVHHDRKMDADDPFDTLSGTLGLTGAADTILVMKRKDGAVRLHVRGRDVEEADVALQFNKLTCRWTILDPASEEETFSTERRQVIDAFADFNEKDGLSVSEIMAGAGRSDRNAVDQLLWKMRTDGEIERVRRGVYRLPNKIGKIGKKQINGHQVIGSRRESENLTNLTDLTGFHADGLDMPDIPDFLRRDVGEATQ